ncbi:S-layer homology domain-containing protein [Gorillibacterium sp. sgz500922]|uniref:S-layer homology domain-containing protein n=1 Tax=Gorillibacterium sp. sgz500922 TaxID=3446694 RepID=UPI003F67D8E1
MNRKLNQFLLALLVMLVVNPFIPSQRSSASAEARISISSAPPIPILSAIHSVTLNASVTDWVYDREAGTINAVTRDSNQLVILNADDLTVNNQIAIGNKPTDIELFDGLLFIALSGEAKIKVVDPRSGSLIQAIDTIGNPRYLAVTEDAIFYAPLNRENGYSVFRFDRSSGQNEGFSKAWLINPALLVDPLTNTLYMGETGSTGSNITAINYVTKETLAKSAFHGGYGVNNIDSPPILEGASVFYGGSRLNAANVADTIGTYPTTVPYQYDAQVLDVRGGLVATESGLFDRDRYQMVTAYPYPANRALIGDNGLTYLQRTADQTIEAYALVRSQPLPSLQFTANNHRVDSNYPIDSWTTDKSSAFLYGVSSATDELVALNKSDLSVAAKRFVGSRPVHVALYEGKLYIALQGETAIGIVDTHDIQTAPISRLVVKGYPTRVLPAKDWTFYWPEKDRFSAANGQTERYVLFEENKNVLAADYDSLTDKLFYIENYGTLRQLRGDNLSEERQVEVGAQLTASLFVQGSDLYLNDQRRQTTDLDRVVGSFPETIMADSDGMVMGKTGIYNRDTQEKIATLPFSPSSVFVQSDPVSGDPTFFLGASQKLFKFNGLSDLMGYGSSGTIPQNVSLSDTDGRAGWVSGILSFHVDENEGNVKSYQLFFLDAQGNRLASIPTGDGPFVYTTGTMLRYFNLQPVQVPAAATHLGLYALTNKDTPENTIPGLGSLWDMPDYSPGSLRFEDKISEPGYIGGTATWKSDFTRTDAMYTLSFYNGSAVVGDPLVQVASGRSDYTIELPRTPLPNGCVGLALTITDKYSAAPVRTMQYFKRFKSPVIEVKDVSIIKYKVKSDEVTVRNVAPGDQITVYSPYGFQLSQAVTVTNANQVTMEIADVGPPKSKILVSRKVQGKYESDLTAVTIPEITDDSGNGGATASPSPSPEASPSPSPSPGASPSPSPSPRPGASPSPSPTGSSNPDSPAAGPIFIPPVASPSPQLSVVSDTASDGRTIGLVDVSTEYVKQQLSEEAIKAGMLTLSATGKEETLSFRLPMETIQYVKSKLPTGNLRLETGSAALTLEVSQLLARVQSTDTSSSLVITIGQADNGYSDKLKKQFPSKSSAVGAPTEFTIKLTGSSSRELKSFDGYVEHTLQVPNVENLDIGELAGMVYDPVSKAFTPVPAKFEVKGGVLTASLFRKGNSVYAIVREKHAVKDLPQTAAYSESIQALIGRSVITGYGDGTFRPERTVTRAEFAVMLDKALGLMVSDTAAIHFKDVPRGSWYERYVNAAVEAGIITGYTGSEFKPNQTISHQEMVVMLARALTYAGYKGTNETANTDPDPAEIASWAKASYELAKKAQLFGQSGDVFVFGTNQSTSRQESALLLYRLTTRVLFP